MPPRMRRRRRCIARLILFSLLAVLLIGCEDQTPVLVVRPPATSDHWYDIYFTDPRCPPENQRTGGIDETIATDIRDAQLQVDVAAFDLDSRPIIDALLDRQQAGLVVRVVVDEANTPAATVNRLRRGGISVVTARRTQLMHNKFVVIDGRFLWVGSMNLTSNGAHCNNNNIVRFDLPQLAANYRAEMDEMYRDGSFGPTSPINTPHERLADGGVSLENYFGPETRLAPIIADEVRRARREILFLAFVFTHNEIGDAVTDRAAARIPVRGVFERVGASTQFSYYPVFAELGLDHVEVRLDGNPRAMHHKVFILDRETTIFGSFNFTAAANDGNDENIIIVRDPVFTGYFVEEFEAVWAEATADN